MINTIHKKMYIECSKVINVVEKKQCKGDQEWGESQC